MLAHTLICLPAHISPVLTVHLFLASVSLFLSCKQVHLYHLFRSAVIQSYIHSFLYPSPYSLSQGTECGPLCCAVGSCCLPILCNRWHLLMPNSRSSPPSPLGRHQPVLCVCVCVTGRFICVTFQIPHLSDFTWCLSVCVRLPSCSVILSRSICVLTASFFSLAE